MKKLLFGTKNSAKLNRLGYVKKALNAEIVDPEDLGLNIDVVEGGRTPGENALIC